MRIFLTSLLLWRTTFHHDTPPSDNCQGLLSKTSTGRDAVEKVSESKQHKEAKGFPVLHFLVDLYQRTTYMDDDDDDTAVVWLLACLLGGFCQEKSLLLFFSKTDQKVMLALDGRNSSSSPSFTGPYSSTHSTKDTVTALNKSKYPKVYTCGTFIRFQGSLWQSLTQSNTHCLLWLQNKWQGYAVLPASG